jgi:hypothetical protein
VLFIGAGLLLGLWGKAPRWIPSVVWARRTAASTMIAMTAGPTPWKTDSTPWLRR